MTEPLTTVISWLMEYSLRYNLPLLKSELINLFPDLVVFDKLDIPDKQTLVDLAALRLIASSEETNEFLNNLDELKTLIRNFDELSHDTDFVKKPARRLQLEDFLNKLKMVKGLLQLKIMMSNIQNEYQDLVSEDFEVSNRSYSPACKKLKRHCFKEMLNMVDGKIIDIKKIDTHIADLKVEVVQHNLIQTFDTYANENVFKQKLTALELFIKNRNEYLPTEVSEVQLLSDHMKKDSLKDKSKVEDKLIKVAESLAEHHEKKEPNWCPVIYLDDAITGGITGIKIKNAYEDIKLTLALPFC